MTTDLIELRRAAEARATLDNEKSQLLSADETRCLLQELRAHQIELEMQNEALRQTHDELLVYRERYADLYDFAPVGYLTLSDKGLIVEANMTIAEMLDVERSRLINQPLSSFVAADDQDNYYLQLSQTKKTRHWQRCELRLGGQQAQLFWAAIEGRVIKGNEANADCLRITISDISGRKKAEEKLRQSAIVVENTAEAVMVTDPQNNITSINRAFTEITAYEEAEVFGLNPRLLQSERNDPTFYQSIWACIQQYGKWQDEIWYRRKNGEIFPAWSTISAVYDGAGELTHYVSLFSDISVIKQSQEKMDFLAYHDPLTHLANRLLFEDRLKHALHHAHRMKGKLAVLFLDLDHFKNINDSLGHSVGDELLQQAAQRLKILVREDDTVARLGGDEYVIILEGFNEILDVTVFLNKLLETFRKPFFIAGHELHVTLSIGASFYPADGKDSEELIKNADTAMYRAKEQGRNGYHLYTRELSAEVSGRLILETDLRHALERKEMLLHYQPQYSLQTGKIVGIEALIRWQRMGKELIYPANFIALAEDRGLITSLGQWVLRQACQQMKAWLEAGFVLQRLAVNVSAIQLRSDDFVETVAAVLKQTGLPAKYLELEITEGVIMNKIERGIRILNQLKALGVTLAIDDFGTGYSSLSYLKRLPLDRLKIDQSFVRDIPGDADDEAITLAIVALGKSLNLAVIAEGVETEVQRSFLESLDCDAGQGYLFSLPVTAQALTSILHRQSLQP